MHWNPSVGVPLLILGLIALALIWLFGQPRKPRQGRRRPVRESSARHEPSLADVDPTDADTGAGAGAEEPIDPRPGELPLETAVPMPAHGDPAPAVRATPATARQGASTPAPASHLGRRPQGRPMERIVSLFLVGRDGQAFHGSDLVVAMDKAGLEFGDLNIYHRLLDGKPDAGAVFSVANMVKPGSFRMETMEALETPGLSFFMTLPGPLPALDAWDMMLPTAQRLERLLDGQLLDDERNALGRQRIAHVRDDLRGWDRRRQERPN